MSVSYVARLAGWLARAIGDSRELFASFSTEAMGLNLPAPVVNAPAVQSALQEAEAAATNVGSSGTTLENAASSGDEVETVIAFVQFGAALTQFYLALDRVVDAVGANVSAATIPDATERAAAQQFAERLARTLSDAILAAGVTNQAPQIAFILRLLGLIDWRRIPRDPANTLSRDHVLRRLQLHRVKDLFSDPAAHYRDALKWGDATFDPSDIFALYASFWDEEVDVEHGVDAGEPYLRQGWFRVTRDGTTNPPSLRLTLEADLDASFESRLELDDTWGANVAADMLLTGSVNGRLRPPLALDLLPAAGSVDGTLKTFVDRNPAARPFTILDGIGVLSMVADNLTAGVGLKASVSTAEGVAVNPMLFVNLDKLTLKIGSDDADSFIGSLLSSAEIEGQFDLGLEWTGDTGLRVKASGGIEIALPIHRQLGPIEFETVYLALRILDDGTLSLEISTALNGLLGPLTASVDRMGVRVDLSLADGTDAAFGPFDVSLGFKPPNGIGLAIDAGVVKGGGYVYLDYEKGEYAGALELTFSDFLSLKAIGLINTKLPGGGFSLLIIITAEFNPGIQLGFGFALSGVGGLLGLHRTVMIDALVQGVRTGAVSRILFPTDVIANAPRIISDLKAIFPPKQGVFLVGPMAKISWGTPALLNVSLGLVIQIPGNPVLLGKLRLALPTDDASAVLVLQISFIGVLEIDKRRLWFFATLFESKLLFITLEGEMGLLMDFSDNPNFVMSVGGFHPRFTAPPLPFPAPKRLALTLINESWAKVRVEMYNALTSNSVQLGARLDAFFGLDACSVQGHFSFDALLRFSPFYLIVQVSVGFSVKVFGVGVFKVHLRGSLEGPTPWRVNGSAEISLLFWSFDVDVEVTFGQRRSQTLPPIAVLPAVRAELEKPASWRALLPGRILVTLRDLGGDAALVLHPIGTLEISQRFVPLNVKLDKVGNQKPSDVKRVAVTAQSVALALKGAAREKFAAAQYRDMSDSEKLSAPAYEPMDSGVQLGAATTWTTGTAAHRNVRYETIMIDTAFERFSAGVVKILDALFTHFRRGAAVSRSPLSKANEKLMQPFDARIAIAEDAYVVARTVDNVPYGNVQVFGSYAEAASELSRLRSADARIAGDVHVIPVAEAQLAA